MLEIVIAITPCFSSFQPLQDIRNCLIKNFILVFHPFFTSIFGLDFAGAWVGVEDVCLSS